MVSASRWGREKAGRRPGLTEMAQLLLHFLQVEVIHVSTINANKGIFTLQRARARPVGVNPADHVDAAVNAPHACHAKAKGGVGVWAPDVNVDKLAVF